MSESPAKKRFTARDLWAIPRVGTPAPAPDGGFVVVGVTEYAADGDDGKERLYRVDTTPHRGDPLPLTSPDVSSSQPSVSPDGKQLAFVRKPPGGGPPQLHVMPLDGGEARRLGDFPLGVSDPRWHPNGIDLVVLSPLYRDPAGGGVLDLDATRRLREERAKNDSRPHVTEDRVYRFWDRWLTDGEVHHLFLVHGETGAAKDLTPGSERWFDLMDPDGDYDIDPDGREIVFSANATSPPYAQLRPGIFTVTLEDGVAGPVVPRTPDNPADDLHPRYSPDGRWIVYGQKRDLSNSADRVRIVRLDRSTGEHVVLTEDWDFSPSSWEFAGDDLVMEVDDHGRTCLYKLDVARGGVPERIACDGVLHAPRPARDGFVYVQHHGLTHPPEVARVPLGGGAVQPLTVFTEPALRDVALARFEELTVPGAGGDPVHVFLVLPPDAPHEHEGPLPLLQIVHGGPYGAFGDHWHWRWNAHVFAAPGYAVSFVNFHGSAGYGQRFSDSVLGDWGGKAAEDILLATDALVARGVADPARLVLAGGSYGGYMASWLPTQTDRFACTVVHAPVFNVLGMCSGDFVQGVEREMGGEPWDMPRTAAALARHSPAAHTGTYRTPTLVLHGQQDFRCPVEHGLELYGVLKAKGVPARLVHYPDESHWILKRRNSIHWYGEVLSWTARHVGTR